MKPGKRLFVGARISVGTANALAGCAETLARRAKAAGIDLRWVAPAHYHVTLAFLGWTGIDAIDSVCDALVTATTGLERIAFRTSRLGAFPSLDQAGVLWAGVAGIAGNEEAGAPLGRLAQSVGDAMAQLGFARDPRPFHAHVTLARLREPRSIREVVLPMAEQMFGDTRIDAVTLFESETKSSGSVYRELEKISFRKAPNPPLGSELRQTVPVERGPADREPDEMQTQTDDGWPRGQGPTD
jgi:2'-5' RNA ligase